jgi:hypothetical protein
MRAILSFVAFAIVLGAVPSRATLTDPAPPNPCPGGAKLKGIFPVLDVSGDGGIPPACNGTFVETAITCISKESAGKPVDFAIEYFDASGALISPPVPVAACGLATGASVTFTTRALPPPYTPSLIVVTGAPAPGPLCPPFTPGCFLHGSARILATSRRIQCSAARLDFGGRCLGVAPQLPTKDLTILYKGKQIGD